MILSILDMAGTFAFAISGAFRAVKYEMDALGVLALAAATGVGGGIVRDVLLGETPPRALQSMGPLLICGAGAVAVFFYARRIAERWNVVQLADAAGLGLFAAQGAATAEAAGANGITIVLMAAMTACGGGVIRDILVREIPSVLISEVYATAAMFGGVVFWVSAGLPETVRLACAAVAAWGIRLVAMRLGLSLPRVRKLPASPSHLWKKKQQQ